MHLIKNLKWRYATKKMDASKKVSENDIYKIKEAIQLAASSFGLQPFKIIDVRDESIRKRLYSLCWNQSQIIEASHLFIFCNKLNVGASDVERLLELKAQTNDLKKEQIAGYGNFMVGKLKEKSKEEMFHWTAKQTYIALANALMACAELNIDSTPIEGFQPDKVSELLLLEEQGMYASVILAIGYRSSEDLTQYNKKVRKPIDELFIEQ